MNTDPSTAAGFDAQNPRVRRHVRLLKLESLATMAAGIAHDFNNHLAAILGNNGVVQRSLPADARSREYLQRIDAAGHLALQLSNQLATYSGRIELNPVPVDPAELLDAVCTAAQPRLPPGVTLASEIAPGTPAPSADPELLRKALGNLIANGADAMVDLRGVIRLAARPYAPTANDEEQAFFPLVTPGAWIEFAVTDAGRGVPPMVRDRIFDPFFSTKIRGHGMGLPEVLGIMRLHNGNIVVDSPPGQGTTIRLLLPVAGLGD